MPPEDTTPSDPVVFKIPAAVHREIKIEAAYTAKSMIELIAEAWDAYKRAVPQPWREPATQPDDAPARKRRAS